MNTQNTYFISKKFEASPSKNIERYEKGLTLEQAKEYLQREARLWRSNAGVVVEQNDEYLLVEEADGSEAISFTIVEDIYND